MADKGWFAVAGYRTVPIETGQTYHAKDAGTRLLTIEEFIQSYIMPGHDTLPPINSTSSDSLGHDDGPTFSSAPCGYLAQHELLEQIPALKKDIVIPDFCSLLLDEDEMAAPDDISSPDVVHSAASVNDPKEIMIQAWFGPLGTVSPLHFDAYHNILVQLSGYKFIRLYPPTESSKLYPMSGRMTNNSQVDLQQYYGVLLNGNSDEEYVQRFVATKDAQYLDCIIGPGDMIYIPRGWWHYIQAIDEKTAKAWESAHVPGTVFAVMLIFLSTASDRTTHRWISSSSFCRTCRYT